MDAHSGQKPASNSLAVHVVRLHELCSVSTPDCTIQNPLKTIAKKMVESGFVAVTDTL